MPILCDDVSLMVDTARSYKTKAGSLKLRASIQAFELEKKKKKAFERIFST